MKKDLITLSDFSSEELRKIIDLSLEMKKERDSGKSRMDMRGKTAVLIFDKPSLRTKITFETAIYELGGNALDMPSSNGKLGERECIYDMAKNLERWVHLLVVRTFSHAAIKELAEHANIPVINALTDMFHPCQSLAFGAALKSKFGDKKIKVAFVGDGNNVCASHLNLCAKLGYDFAAISPAGFEPNAEVLANSRGVAAQTGSLICVTTNIEEGLADADVVYTDVWASMGQEEKAAQRREVFAPYQVNAATMKKAKEGALFSHCLPAHRGQEVTDEVLDAGYSLAFDEAEYRLHAHKAIILYLLQQSK